MRLWRSAPLGLLVVLAGCDALQQQERVQPYAPWETGLTLIYERQDVSAAERVAQRVQVRVEACMPRPEGFDVELSTSSLTGMRRNMVRLERGGLAVLEGDRPVAVLLPEGFPDRVTRWEVGPVAYEVVGRAQADASWLNALPESARTGVWVEGRGPDGTRHRVLYLPGIGEVETLQWSEGRWKPLLRMVSRGFTDPAPGRRAPVA